MRRKLARLGLVLLVGSNIVLPVYARGGFGGGHFGGGGGRGFGGGHFGGGGGGRGFGGGHFGGGGGGGHFSGGGGFSGHSGGFGERGAGGFGERGAGGFGERGAGGFGERGAGGFAGGESHHYGGGFNSMSGAGEHGYGQQNHPNYGNNPNFHNDLSKYEQHPPTGSGFGEMANVHNQSPQTFNKTNLNAQGTSVRNSFNNDNFNHTTNVNNFNHVGGYGNYGHYGAYGYGHYGGYGAYGYHGWGYPGAWAVPGWSAATAWTSVGLASLTSFLGIAALASSGSHNTQPSVSNVTYNGGNVYVDGQPAATEAQYYQQAQQLAGTAYNSPVSSDQVYYAAATNGCAAGSVSPTPDLSQQWQPLGVFGLAEPGQTQSNMLLQMAINKDGVVRGNYFNQLTNESSEVYGALDKSTQRISWTIGKNQNTVFDASLPDLVQQDSTVLVHYSPTNTQTMALIRLQQPPAEVQAPT